MNYQQATEQIKFEYNYVMANCYDGLHSHGLAIIDKRLENFPLSLQSLRELQIDNADIDRNMFDVYVIASHNNVDSSLQYINLSDFVDSERLVTFLD